MTAQPNCTAAGRHLPFGANRKSAFALGFLPLVFGTLLFSAEPAKKQFDLPADVAEASLRKFSAQAGTEVLFATRTVGKVLTKPVQGEYTPHEAIKLLVAGTGLIVAQDERTGAITVSSDPNGHRAAPTTAGGRP